MLIRRCVYENVNRDEIQKLFPNEVLPELQRLLTLLLQKFQREWREDVVKDKNQVPVSKSCWISQSNFTRLGRNEGDDHFCYGFIGYFASVESNDMGNGKSG